MSPPHPLMLIIPLKLKNVKKTKTKGNKRNISNNNIKKKTNTKTTHLNKKQTPPLQS